MMRAHFGAGGEAVPAAGHRRAHFNNRRRHTHGLDLGADFTGERDGMHIEPVDPRATIRRRWCAHPYGKWSTAVAKLSRRRGSSKDLGAFLAALNFSVPGAQVGPCDLTRVPADSDWQRDTRSEVPALRGADAHGNCPMIGVDAGGLARTVTA